MSASYIARLPTGRFQGTPRFYIGRTAGGHRHHRHSRGPIAARHSGSPREQRGELHCTNNLKQIGLAVQNFHDSTGRLPSSRRIFDYITWAAEIWPFLEAGNMTTTWDKTQDYYGQLEEARTVQVPIYYCPSRRSAPQLSITGDNTSGTPGGEDFPRCFRRLRLQHGRHEPRLFAKQR